MPVYEYYCSTCSTRFEKLRPMWASDEAAVCPEGHPNAARTISVFAVSRGATGEIEMTGAGCGCGGGACACGGGMSRN